MFGTEFALSSMKSAFGEASLLGSAQRRPVVLPSETPESKERAKRANWHFPTLSALVNHFNLQYMGELEFKSGVTRSILYLNPDGSSRGEEPPKENVHFYKDHATNRLWASSVYTPKYMNSDRKCPQMVKPCCEEYWDDVTPYNRTGAVEDIMDVEFAGWEDNTTIIINGMPWVIAKSITSIYEHFNVDFERNSYTAQPKCLNWDLDEYNKRFTTVNPGSKAINNAAAAAAAKAANTPKPGPYARAVNCHVQGNDSNWYCQDTESVCQYVRTSGGPCGAISDNEEADVIRPKPSISTNIKQQHQQRNDPTYQYPASLTNHLRPLDSNGLAGYIYDQEVNDMITRNHIYKFDDVNHGFINGNISAPLYRSDGHVYWHMNDDCFYSLVYQVMRDGKGPRNPAMVRFPDNMTDALSAYFKDEIDQYNSLIDYDGN